MKKIAAFLLCALTLCGCAGNKTPIETVVSSDVITLMTEPPPPQTSETSPEIAVEPEVYVPEFPETTPPEYEFSPDGFEKLFEAEEGDVIGNAVKSDEREGFSGSGYVSGIFSGGNFLMTAELSTPQHYDILLRAASDVPAGGQLCVGGAPTGEFEISGSGEFETVAFKNIYIPEKETGISFLNLTAEIDFDCVLIQSADSVYNINYSPEGNLCDKNASESAAKLYELICSQNGKAVLSAQHCAQGSDAELESVYGMTGKYPAIRFGELMDYSAGIDSGDIELSLDWAERGGIVGYSWYWPMNGSCYADKTGFKLENAVTELEVATMEVDALSQRLEAGTLSAETLAVIGGIDLAAQQLKRLDEAGMPVIFRPLPEASGQKFWWSVDRESYLWLYELIYERMTLYWQLDGLIWVWNGEDPEWYVGDELCDIVSLDVYYRPDSAANGRSGVNYLISAYEISDKKPIAMSECDFLPNPDSMAMDRSYWSFCAVWPEFAPDGESCKMAPYDFISFYNSSAVLTKDEIENYQ